MDSNEKYAMRLVYGLMFFCISVVGVCLHHDNTTSFKIKTQIVNTIIEYPGFPSDTLHTDSIEFCIITNYGLTVCDKHELMPVTFAFDPSDSIMIERHDSSVLNIFRVENIRQDSVGKIHFTKYFLKSKLHQYKNNVYIIEKLDNIDYIIMHCVTEKETYRVSFF